MIYVAVTFFVFIFAAGLFYLVIGLFDKFDPKGMPPGYVKISESKDRHKAVVVIFLLTITAGLIASQIP